MKNGRLIRTLISLLFCIAVVAIPAGNAYAMPFHTAVNYPAGIRPQSIATGDFNLDGKLDLAVANYIGSNVSILLGNGDGTFTAAASPTAGNGPVSIAVADFNRDGKPDLAVANNVGGNISILLGNGDGTFSHIAGTPSTAPIWIATGDFNKDGKPDLAVAENNGYVLVLLGNGDGTFLGAEYAAGTFPHGVTVGDFNLDGKPDLAVSNFGSSNVSIFLGVGDGTFTGHTNFPVLTGPYGLTTGDFNMDGKPDLAVANYVTGILSILIGAGNGTFTAAPSPGMGSNPISVTVGDFNQDGKPDLATANYNSSLVSIFIGAGNGTFATAVDYAAGAEPASIAVGDFNRDGAPDLALADDGSNSVAILLNTPAPPTIIAVNPASSTQGQTLNVTITGTNLTGATAINFGTGITVNNVTVNSSSQITARLSIAANAALSARPVSLTTPGGTASKAASFRVLEQSIGTSAPIGSATMTVTPPAPPVSLSNIVVSSANLSTTTVSPNTPVTVTADIANKSTVNGNKMVTVYVNGEIETTQGVTLNSGDSSKLTFNVSRSEPGTYKVYVDGAPAGSFKVEAVTANDTILIVSVAFLAIAFVCGLILLRRRQGTGQS